MDDLIFELEWERVTRITRKRMIHEQLGEINEINFRLDLTVAERASLEGQKIMRNRLFASYGGNDW